MIKLPCKFMGKLSVLTLTIFLLMPGAVAQALSGQETYDLLFRQGTLDNISRDMVLSYRREMINKLDPKAAERATGQIKLSFDADDMAILELETDETHRRLGLFPANVGNPMIIMFYETVIRDMASVTGGSPFYIRNRVKDALIQPGEMEERIIALDGKTSPAFHIRLYPFADDPNKDRMQAFGNLELNVTMSDEVPGWYVGLEAIAADRGNAPLYHLEIKFEQLEKK